MPAAPADTHTHRGQPAIHRQANATVELRRQIDRLFAPSRSSRVPGRIGAELELLVLDRHLIDGHGGG
jgi:hypothetical protein